MAPPVNRQSRRTARVNAVLLTLPLVAFISVTFVTPLFSMMVRGVHDPTVADIMPATVAALRDWDRRGLPPEAVYAAAAQELKLAREQRTIGRLATRLNRQVAGTRSVITRTGRALAREGEPPWSQTLPAMHPAWAEAAVWETLLLTGDRITADYYLNAVDLQRTADGAIVRQPESRRIYTDLFIRTLGVSLTVTLLCLAIGYPLAGFIAHAPPRRAKLLLTLVLLPFWTSLLVRTTSWIVLLQQQGVVNDLLVWAGLVADEQRLTLVYNMTGTLVAMTHVLLPFMVLPLYAVMVGIPGVQMQAAASLGATWPRAFWRVYLPQSMPGVGAGCLLVFILAIGYYITPALVGGQSGQLISNLIAYHIQTSLNWGLGAALGTILFLAVVVLFVFYDRVLGLDRMKLGA
ncbi:MAG: ABC transporter permease [Rhodospirillaceae bacterium]|nr:ABC transporter permease [Rhodospirillaceae bacterium]